MTSKNPPSALAKIKFSGYIPPDSSFQDRSSAARPSDRETLVKLPTVFQPAHPVLEIDLDSGHVVPCNVACKQFREDDFQHSSRRSHRVWRLTSFFSVHL